MSQFNTLKLIVVTIFIMAGSGNAWAAPPFLAFSDIISGPSSGLGDGKGEGVIVSVWGQNLGDTQETSQIFFEDSNGEVRPAPHTYYWKRADGVAPSGPANLSKSHRMQEIAFSIPRSALGPGRIFTRVNGARSNTLDFTVRPGSIFFISAKGTDSSGGGSFSNSWRTVAYADSRAPNGSTIYILDVDTGDRNSQRAIYWNKTNASSTLDAQFAFIAYPGYQPKVIAQRAVENHTTQGMVVSKLDIYASNYLAVDSNGQPSGKRISNGGTYGIQSTKNGRAIGNRIGDIPGGCASKWNGAINGNARTGDKVSNFKGLGNEIYDYGCNGTDKLHHTIYLSVRSDSGLVVEPWEWGYNYLHGNKAKFGIHQYDQGDGCGDLSGPLRIHNNVIVDQAGSGISVGSTCGWSMDMYIENNVLINVGLAAAWDGINPDTSDGPENGGIGIRDSGLKGTAYIRNNLIYKYTEDGQKLSGRGCLNLTGKGDSVKIAFTNNICFTTKSQPFVGSAFNASNKLDNIFGSNNFWIDLGSSNLIPPAWDSTAYTGNLDMNVSKPMFFMGLESELIDKGASVPLVRDIYGTPRDSVADIGPVEFNNNAGIFPPEAPYNFGID
jgi:hypothetical protein